MHQCCGNGTVEVEQAGSSKWNEPWHWRCLVPDRCWRPDLTAGLVVYTVKYCWAYRDILCSIVYYASFSHMAISCHHYVLHLVVNSNNNTGIMFKVLSSSPMPLWEFTWFIWLVQSQYQVAANPQTTPIDLAVSVPMTSRLLPSISPRVGPGYPLSAFAPPLSIHFLIFCSLLLFPFSFSHSLYYLFSFIVHLIPFYQNSPTPFPGVKS